MSMPSFDVKKLTCKIGGASELTSVHQIIC